MAAIPDKDAKCRTAETMIAGGMRVTESCRVMGISEKTLHRWHKAQSLLGRRDAARGRE